MVLSIIVQSSSGRVQAYHLSTVRAGFQRAGRAKTRGAKALWVSPGSLFITGSVWNWRQVWDVARLVLAEGSCCRVQALQKAHARLPRSVAQSVLLLWLLAGGWLNLHSHYLLSKGKSSLLALSSVGEDAMLKDKPKEERGTYRETVSPGTPSPVQYSCRNAS